MTGARRDEWEGSGRVNGLDGFLDIARAAVTEGARLLASTPAGKIAAKSDRDYVTELDVEIQMVVQEFLARHTPEIGFLGEEANPAPDLSEQSRWWTLDPIDGTSNFVHGLPLCAVSLALVEHGRSVLGVVNAPFLDLEYHATLDAGASVNDAPMTASTVTRLSDAVISLGDYAVGAGAARKNRERLAITAALAERVERVRMFGSAALDLVWVAEGRTDGCVMLSNKPWDTAAGALIAAESGALVTDTDGSPHTVGSKHTIAAAPGLSAELLRLVADARAGHH
nr:inositol monophosphatase family protein [Nocardia farcinica]